ncbi:MAG: response regulator [Herminiimonas sp.]|nr:response regulator [Herminiimonas sp.]
MNETQCRDRRPVLVVEDTEDDYETVVEAARRARVENQLVHAADASTAARLLYGAPADTFAFVLLDYNLPGVDGLEFLDELRRHPVHRRLPVVIFTASVNARDRAAFHVAGASAYHVKVMQFDRCLGMLQDIFDRWLTPRAPPGSAACAPPQGASG